MPHDGGTILLATSPGTLVRLTFLDERGTPGRTFASNLRVRSAALYTLSYGSIGWCPWQELHLHCAGFESVVSAVGLHGH